LISEYWSVRVNRWLDDLLGGRHEEGTLVLDVEKTDASDAFQHDLEVAARLPLGGQNAAEGADIEEVLWPGIVDLFVPVRRHRDHPARHHRLFHGMNRARSTDLQRHHIPGEDHNLPEGEQRYLVCGFGFQATVQPLELSHATTLSLCRLGAQVVERHGIGAVRLPRSANSRLRTSSYSRGNHDR
jgi:hypothetical protein